MNEIPPERIHQHVRAARRARFLRRERPLPAGGEKKYARFVRIPLPDARPLEITLSEACAARTSTRINTHGPVITLQKLSDMCATALSARSNNRRPYPSGGGLYPVETYLFAYTIDGLARGIYHYHPRSHALERLWDLPEKFEPFRTSINDSWAQYAQAYIVFTARWQQTSRKYGEYGYMLALIEAGHMAQNILLSAAALKIGACPAGGFDDAVLIESLDLDPDREQPIYLLSLFR